ncbi:MAG: shikimate kinase [Anaerolineae bacterium]
MAIPDANIILTGFMATGKTTIGRRVALLLDRRFVDADDVIVERGGMSIPQIFATDGEAAFRALEKEVCRDLAAERGLVIATGGGMLVDPDNLARMMDERAGRVPRRRARRDPRAAGAGGRPSAGGRLGSAAGKAPRRLRRHPRSRRYQRRDARRNRAADRRAGSGEAGRAPPPGQDADQRIRNHD